MTKNQAFAIYSEDDSSLTFYAGQFFPDDQECYNNKTITGIWTARNADFDVWNFSSSYGWCRFKDEIKIVITDPSFITVKPVSTCKWFYELKKCEAIDLTYLNTSKVTNMGYMFAECRKLKDIKMKTFVVDRVKYMAQMFANCTSLTSLKSLSTWQTGRCKNMFAMFINCSSLTSLNLSSWKTSNVENMTSMFSGCTSLKKIGDLSGWDTSSVECMDHMFKATPNLNLNDSFFN